MVREKHVQSFHCGFNNFLQSSRTWTGALNHLGQPNALEREPYNFVLFFSPYLPFVKDLFNQTLDPSTKPFESYSLSLHHMPSSYYITGGGGRGNRGKGKMSELHEPFSEWKALGELWLIIPVKPKKANLWYSKSVKVTGVTKTPTVPPYNSISFAQVPM